MAHHLTIPKQDDIAKYKCLRCKHVFNGEPGPGSWPTKAMAIFGIQRTPTQCPECNHLYVKWLNYNA